MIVKHYSEVIWRSINLMALNFKLIQIVYNIKNYSICFAYSKTQSSTLLNYFKIAYLYLSTIKNNIVFINY